jgi:hypothetical protein
VKGRITGTVVDDQGTPVRHMVLEYEQLDGRWMRSGQKPMTQTDGDGHFSIDIFVNRQDDGTLDGGRWAVYPHVDHSKKRNYYVDQFNRFYHVGHAPEISITPESPNAVVEIRLDPKGGAIMGSVTDAATGSPIESCRMELSWTSDPSRGMGGGMGSRYRWLVPANTEITLKIGAKGYRPQEYHDLLVPSGQDKVLDIQLQPDAK